jgi:gamma-glutamyltranspeptidase/glutathione hydrolase
MLTAPAQRVERDLAIGRQFMVVTKHPWATQAALDVLEHGGNAVDAAVTAAFGVGVLEPWMSGIGGGGFMTIQKATGERAVIDYFARAPRAARPDLYRLVETVGTDGTGYTGVQDAVNAHGPLSVGVPGAVAGLSLALERFGSIDLAQALAPAIRFAETGFEVGWYQAVIMASEQARLRRESAAASVFLRDGVSIAPSYGTALPRVIQVEQASTLRRIADRGPDGFYRGEVAQRIVDHLQACGGFLSSTDLADYRPVVVQPLVTRYRDLELLLLPYQAGGVTTSETLNVLDGFDLSSSGHNTATSLHLIAEASRRAFADRAAYVGDPDFCDTDWARLTSAAYAAERRAEIDPRRASLPRAGDGLTLRPAGRDPAPVSASAGGCTTTLSVVDGDGSVVTVTQTLTLLFGSCVLIPGTGVLLNDSMSLFDPRPGGVNAVGPWKRPASSMAHVIAVHDGVPVLAMGAPGGRRIMDTCLQMVLNVCDYGLDVQAACSAPLIDCSEAALLADDRLTLGTRQSLRDMGHQLTDVTVSFWPRHFASPAGVAIDRRTGLRTGGIDPFGPGLALGR